MKKLLFVLIALVVFSSHDMYLKLDTFFLHPNESATIKLFNGTFDKSENVITRDRMIDVSLVGNGQRARVDTAQWSEKDNMTLLNFTTGEAGTWVAGVSTRPRNIEMTAEDFNGYLEHDGVLDMLEWRKEHDALDQDAVEKYSKHIKAIFQVGDTQTEDWKTVLGYPIEFVPLSNPYDLHPGHALQVQLLWQGKPLANQIVYVGLDAAGHEHSHEHADEAEHEHSHEAGADHDHEHGAEAEHEHSHEAGTDHDHEHADEAGHEHSHDAGTDHDHEHADEAGHEHSHDAGADHDHEHGAEAGHDHEHADEGAHEHDHEEDQASEGEEDHHHHAATQLRTDAEGKLSVDLTAEGLWYLRTIHLAHSEESGLTHESNWATLTFEVGQGHSHEHDHADEAAHSHGIPAYVYWIGSLLLLGGLFFWFNRKNEELV